MLYQSSLVAAAIDPGTTDILIGIAVANIGIIFTGIFTLVWKMSALETKGEEYRRDINNLGRLYRSGNKAPANQNERKAG